jgi:hypothetical protein
MLGEFFLEMAGDAAVDADQAATGSVAQVFAL